MPGGTGRPSKGTPIHRPSTAARPPIRRAPRLAAALAAVAALAVPGGARAGAAPVAAPFPFAPERLAIRLSFGVDDRLDGHAGLTGDVAFRPVPQIGPALAWSVGFIPLDPGGSGDGGDGGAASWSLMGGLRIGPPPAPASPRVQLDVLAGAGRRAAAAMATVVVDEEVVDAFPLLRFDLRALGPAGGSLAFGPRLRVDLHWLSIRRDVVDPEGVGERVFVLEPRGFEALLAFAGGVLLPGAALEWSVGGGVAASWSVDFHGSEPERGAAILQPTAQVTFGVALGAGRAPGGAR